VSDGFREIDLTDPEQGELKLLVVLQKGDDPWGVLAPLRDTAWGEQVAVVSGSVFEHALRGWATPLMREIGVTPRVRARRISEEAGRCGLHGPCLGSKPHCRPGPDLPNCYEAPDLEWGAGLAEAVRVALAWREGRYVVVVEGKGSGLS
jgi:hypothetical protein